MPIDPSIVLGVRPLEVPNKLAQYGQMAQIETAQRQGEAAQIQLEELKNDRLEMKSLQADIARNGGNPDLHDLAARMMKTKSHFTQGYELLQKLREQDKFEVMGRKLYPEMFGGETPTTAAPIRNYAPTGVAPAAAPLGALGSGTFGAVPEPVAPASVAGFQNTRGAVAPVNTLAPAPAPTVNALATQEKTPDQLRREIMLFSQSTDPRAKSMADMLKAQLVETLKSTTVSPGQEVYKGGKVVYSRESTPSEFERLLATSNLSELEKNTLRIQRAKKEATHAPGTTVNVSTEKKYGEAFGGKIADVDINKMTTAQRAPQLADNANQIIGLVQQGNLFTGPAADIKLNIARAMNVAGANNQEKIANTEALIAASGQSTLDAIKGAGLGTGQGFTDKDLSFLKNIAGGTINLTPQTLTNLAALQHKAAVRSADMWNSRVKDMPEEVLKGTGVSKTPVVVPPLMSLNVKKPAVNQIPAPTGIDPALWGAMTPQERALWQK